jgi:hypothetical protein
MFEQDQWIISVWITHGRNKIFNFQTWKISTSNNINNT